MADTGTSNGNGHGRPPSAPGIIIGYRTVLMALIGVLSWMAVQIWSEIKAIRSDLVMYANTTGQDQVRLMSDEGHIADHETRIRDLDGRVTTIEAHEPGH